MKRIKAAAVSAVCVISSLIFCLLSSAAEPRVDNPHVVTCGASTFVLDADNSLWFFGVDRDGTEYLTPVKVMENVKKVTLGNMSTTLGAYMPTCMILTYNNDLYIGGECRYSPFNISDNISLVRHEKIWDDVKDMGTPSGYGFYTILENSGELHQFNMGEESGVSNIGNDSLDEHTKSLRDWSEWKKEHWWDIGDVKEEDMAAGFYVIVKTDGSVWTGVRDWGLGGDYYHGYVMGNGTGIINSYYNAMNIDPIKIFPEGSCTKKTEVFIDGQKMQFNVQPVIINDRVMVPLRTIFEALGAAVEWNSETKEISAKKDGTSVNLTVGSVEMYINNEQMQLDAAPFVVDGTTLVPVRAVSEAFGAAKVEWDGSNKAVRIETGV